ncbi:MAG: DUF5678 domain-containing protein [Microthrixaceae bacterium]
MQNTIQLPQEMYETVRRKALAQRKTTDDLVIEWVAEHLEEPTTDENTQALDREVAAYEQLKPALLEQYAGQYVAIYQGQVVASGTDKLALVDQVRQRLGNVICYVEKVSEGSPRTVRMPSFRVVRS